MTHDVLVFTGKHQRANAEAIRMTLSRTGSSGAFFVEARDAVDALASRPLPRLVVADITAPEVMAVIQALREEPRLYAVPVIVIVPDVSTASFDEAHSLGADGVVAAGHWDSLQRCVEVVLDFDPSRRIPVAHGTVLVAHPDPSARRALARGLRRAGFGVAFAATASDIADQIAQSAPRALVVQEEILGDEAAEMAAALHDRSGAAILILTQTRRLRALASEATQLVGVGAVTCHMCSADLLFLLGELLRPDVANVRATRRVLHAAVCRFRVAGEPTEVHGLTYNISQEGMYVRTLDPPEHGTRLWFELAPAGLPQLVHLRVEVVWRRGAQVTSAGGPVPPGFGLRIIEEACPPRDLELYRMGYRRLLTRGGHPESCERTAPEQSLVLA